MPLGQHRLDRGLDLLRIGREVETESLRHRNADPARRLAAPTPL